MKLFIAVIALLATCYSAQAQWSADVEEDIFSENNVVTIYGDAEPQAVVYIHSESDKNEVLSILLPLKGDKVSGIEAEIFAKSTTAIG